VHPFGAFLALGSARAVLFPVVWLLTLPFRLIGITFEALLALVRAVFMLPARLLGWRRSAIQV